MNPVYFYVYPSAFQNPGGGEVQLLKTKEYLEKGGLKIRLYDPWRDRFGKGDILHVFGSVKYCYGLMRAAKEVGARIVLSTICWYDWPSAFFTYADWRQRGLNILRHFAKTVLPGVPSMRKAMMQISDLLLPNSQAEARQLVRYFGVGREKIKVIPNGVDAEYEKSTPDLFNQKYDLRDFYLCVGRIEPRKNQLALIRAHHGLKKSLVIIGESVPRYTDYQAQCRREASSNVHFLGSLPNDSEMLRSAYAACQTFVLPSWFETPGLAAMEAALSGANLVLTRGGATQEYFKNEVLYVDPHRIDDIRQKLTESGSAAKNGRLRGHLRQNYLWDKVAEKVLAAYRSLL